MIFLVIKGFLKKVLPFPIRNFLRSIYWRAIGEIYSPSAFFREMKRKAQQLKPIYDGPLVSILCSAWNTPPDYLNQMLDSIASQSYRNWELLINNCSDPEHPQPGQIIRTFADQDARIKIFRLENQGIALNTNAVAEHAAGDFILLMDHDDLLMPDTLEKLMECQMKQNADFVYSDEYVLQMQFSRIWHRHKQPFSMEALESDNFINHPALIRRSLFEAAGGFRAGFEGSQDYDLYFRLLEKTDKIAWLKLPLYVWRVNANSFSERSLETCIQSGKRAIEEHLERVNCTGMVLPIGRSTNFRIKNRRKK